MPRSAREPAARRPRSQPLPLELGGTVRVGGAGRVVGAYPRPSVRRPSKTSFVEIASRSIPRAAQAWARRPVAVPLRRIARSGSSAQPSTSVQAAAWTTTSGRSASRRRRSVRRVQVKGGPIPGDGPAGPVNGASPSARRQRPTEPTARAGHRDPHQAPAAVGAGRRRGRRRKTPLPVAEAPEAAAGRPAASRRAVLALVPAIPITRLRRAPPGLIGSKPVDGGRETRRRTTRRAASPARELRRHPWRSGGRARADPRPRGPATRVCRAAPAAPPTTSRLARSLATGHVVGLATRPVAEDEVDRGGMVGNVQPVAALKAVAIERQRQVIERIGDEQRDQLLGVVIRAVRVGTARHDGIEADA